MIYGKCLLKSQNKGLVPNSILVSDFFLYSFSSCDKSRSLFMIRVLAQISSTAFHMKLMKIRNWPISTSGFVFRVSL